MSYFGTEIETVRKQRLGEEMYGLCQKEGLTKDQLLASYQEFFKTNKFDSSKYSIMDFMADCKFKTFEEFMQQHLDEPEIVYEKVQDYHQLLLTNIAFLNSKLAHSFNYFARWGSPDAEDQNTHAQVATQNLITLHQYGILTTNGQSAYCELDTYIPPWEKEHNGQIVKGGDIHHYSLRQRSYVNCYMPENMAVLLLPHLLNDKRICISMHYPEGDMRYIDNVPAYKENNGYYFDLTTEQIGTEKEVGYTIWRRENRDFWSERSLSQSMNEPEHMKRVLAILDQLMLVQIMCIHFCEEPTAEQILLHYVKQYFQPNSYPNVYNTQFFQ